MHNKFETLVKKQEDILNEAGVMGGVAGAVGGAVRWAQNAQSVRNFMNQGKQGSNEGDNAYRQRMLARGNIREALKEYKNYQQGRIPIILDFDKNYSKLLQPKIEQVAKRFVKQSPLDMSEFKPTIAYINDGINYNAPCDPNSQIEFFNKCVKNIKLNNANSIKAKSADVAVGRYFIDVNIGGVILQFAIDLENAKQFIPLKNSDEVGSDGLVGSAARDIKRAPVIYDGFQSWKSSPSLIEQDKNTYKENVRILLDPIRNAVLAVVNEMYNIYDENFQRTRNLQPAQQTSGAAPSGGPVDPGSGAPEAPATTSGSPANRPIDQLNINELVEKVCRSNPKLAESTRYTSIVKMISEKILQEAQTATSIQEGLNIFVSALNGQTEWAFEKTIGCQEYPEKQGDEKLREFYYNKLAKAAATAGIAGFENDIFFVPPREINRIKHYAEQMLGRQAVAWGLDKLSAMVQNAIQHPFKTSEKLAGKHSFSSMQRHML